MSLVAQTVLTTSILAIQGVEENIRSRGTKTKDWLEHTHPQVPNTMLCNALRVASCQAASSAILSFLSLVFLLSRDFGLPSFSSFPLSRCFDFSFSSSSSRFLYPGTLKRTSGDWGQR